MNSQKKKDVHSSLNNLRATFHSQCSSYGLMAIFLLTLLVCCLSIISSQDCISIDQPDDAYLHHPTTLYCKARTAGVWGDNYPMIWYLHNRSARTRKYLSYATEDGVTINQNYSWKITSEWDGVSATFSMTIKNATSMDDGAYTLWECEKRQAGSSKCTGSARHAIDVKVGKCKCKM